MDHQRLSSSSISARNGSSSSSLLFRYCCLILIAGGIGIVQSHLPIIYNTVVSMSAIPTTEYAIVCPIMENRWITRSRYKEHKRTVLKCISSSVSVSERAIIGCRGGADWDVNLSDENNRDEEGYVNSVPNESDVEEESDGGGAESEPVAAVSKAPVKLIIKTALNSHLIDQSIELTASRTRDVASLKLSCFRQMRGRPPVELQTIRQGIITLEDHMTIDEILGDEDDDDDDDDEEEEADEVALILTLDMAPPVDPKFGIELGELVKSKTTEELIDAYAANQASLMAVSKQLAEAAVSELDKVIEQTTEECEGEEDSAPPPKALLESETLWMRKQASLVKKQLLSSMSEDTLKMLHKTDEEEESSDALLASSIRRSRRGGAKMNMKRVLQRNLNIDWGSTIRNFLLFLFFGFFGARDVLSRTLMYLGAPMCFVIQTRPAKILIKQVFYGVGTPPGILLSLLPAPQQKIMDLDFNIAMQDLYGSPSSRSFKGNTESDYSDEEDELDYEYDYDE